jgi:hypothetical protein
MVLLAFDDISKSPYKELGTEEQLKKLSSIINLEILSAQMESTGKFLYFNNYRCDTSNIVKALKLVTKRIKSGNKFSRASRSLSSQIHQARRCCE